MAGDDRWTDGRLRRVVLGVLLVVAPLVVTQGLFASLLGDEVKRQACDVDHSGAYFTTPAVAALVAAGAALALAWWRPRLALGAVAVAVLISLAWALRGGWGAGECALGV